MSVLLRTGRTFKRLDLLARWERPPVLAPGAAQRRSLSGMAAGLSDSRLAQSPSEESLGRSLEESRSAGDFRAKGSSAGSVALLIPDKTRRGPWQDWVEASARWLEGIAPDARSKRILVATGVHKPELFDDLATGERWEQIANGDGGYESHRNVGRTEAGTEVSLHPDWVDADLRVALGDISFHYFAGFGGGRKLVFPGLGEPKGIFANHRRSLDAQGRFRKEATSGRLKGNPVHEDLCEAVSLCPPDLLIQVIEPAAGSPPFLQVGDWLKTHEAGCDLYLKGHLLEHTCRPDLLIADAGGAPRDSTFLQAHKSLQHAAKFLAPGGKLLLVAALNEGVGSDTLAMLWQLSTEELSGRAMTDYQLHTHTALALRSVCERNDVAVWSEIDPDLLLPAGITPISNKEEALEWIERDGLPNRWGWLSRAEEALPRLVGNG